MAHVTCIYNWQAGLNCSLYIFLCAGRRSPETPDQREFVKKFVHELEEMRVV